MRTGHAHGTDVHTTRENTQRRQHFFTYTRRKQARRASEPRVAAKAARDAWAARPSRQMIAAALRRRHSCLGSRLAALRRRAGQRPAAPLYSSEWSEICVNAATIGPPIAAETPATSAPTTVMTPVGLAGLCSSE